MVLPRLLLFRKAISILCAALPQVQQHVILRRHDMGRIVDVQGHKPGHVPQRRHHLLCAALPGMHMPKRHAEPAYQTTIDVYVRRPGNGLQSGTLLLDRWQHTTPLPGFAQNYACVVGPATSPKAVHACTSMSDEPQEAHSEPAAPFHGKLLTLGMLRNAGQRAGFRRPAAVQLAEHLLGRQPAAGSAQGAYADCKVHA